MSIDDATRHLQSELYSLYSDMFKDRNGFRPRWLRADDHSVDEWEAKVDALGPLDDYDYDYEADCDGPGEVSHVTKTQPTSGDGWMLTQK